MASQWLTRLEAQPGSEPPLALTGAIDLLVEARVRNGKGGASTTLALAQRVLRLEEEQLGRDHLETAQSIHNLGLVHMSRGELAQAIERHERGLAIRQARLGRDDPSIADSLDHLALCLIQVQRFPDAKQRLDESSRIRELNPGDEIALARTLELVGTLARYAGKYAEAVAPLERALAIRRRLTPEHSDTASVLQIRGDILFLLGDSSGAQKLWSDALALAERTLGPNHPAIAEFLRRLGFAASGFGNMTEARRLRERAFRIGDTAMAPCDPALTRLLNALALSLKSDGDYFEARRLYGRALTTIEKCLGRDHSDYATYVFNDASIALEIGDLVEADRLYERSVQLWSKGLGPNHPFVARGLEAVADVARSRGQLPRSRTLYERALAIYRRELGADHPQVAWTLTSLAKTAADAGDVTLALRYVQQAIAIFQKSGASDTPDHFARVLELRGDLEARRGRLASARASLAAALTERERIFGRTHPLAAETRASLARVDFERGATAPALVAALAAEQAGRDHLRFTVRYLPERQAMFYADKRPRGLDLALSIAASGTAASDTASARARVLGSVIQSRAVVLDELAARGRAIDKSNSQVAALNASTVAARQRFANLMVRSLREAVPGAVLDEARRQKEDAERALAERSGEARTELRRASTSLDDIRRALPTNAALVSFARYERTIVPATGQALQPPVPSYAAFVIRSGTTGVTLVQLGAADAIDAKVRAWRDEASGRSLAAGAFPARAEKQYRDAADSLRQAVWDPIATQVGDAAMIFIVPDGLLNIVNFSALPDRDGRYLVERDAVIHYLSTERDLVVPNREARASGTLLAVGGAEFGELGAVTGNRRGAVSADCEALGRLRFANLPGSLGEVTEISRMWPTSGSSSVTVLSGRAASETAVKRALRGRRVVHLATHGFFLGEGCAPSPAGGTRGSAGLVTASGNPPNRVGEENPLLLSGLVLAGANRRTSGRPGDDDGILTAEEVASLNLRGVEWAVLSACDTGLGEIKAGEGVFGLRRAFQVAGARTVIMSLWSVDDQATRAWMHALYEGRFQKGLTTAAAVRAASAAVLRERRAKGWSTHPFYWAAFVAAGDWR